MKRLAGIAVCLVLLVGSQAKAHTYAFYGIGPNIGNELIGETQLSVVVTDETITDETIGLVRRAGFTFYNTGTEASSITDIYFDDGTLLGIAEITDSGAGVDFSQGANPNNLPGGENADPPFATTAGFSADSNAPQLSANGVNNGSGVTQEWVKIVFNLINGKTFADTIIAISDGSLRMGLHVQAFGNGGSYSFVSNNDDGGSGGGEEVPAPSALAALIGMGLLGSIGVARRRFAKS